MAIERSLAVDDIAQRQHGLITTEQAVEALGTSRKGRWVAEGRLVSVQPAVFRLSGAPETWHQALHAASLAADGIVSHRSAAELWGLIQPAGHIEVAVPDGRRPRLRPPAVAHRIVDLRPGLAVQRQGMPITDPVRTVIDLGLVMPEWSVQRVLSRGLSSKVLDLPAVRTLRDALARPGRNGTGVVRRILDGELLNWTKEESELEHQFTALALRAGLPPLALQHEVWHAGRLVARIDAAYPELRLAIEIDGYEHHSSPDAFQRDRTRQNQLTALGWTVLRFTWADVVKHPSQVAATIAATRERLAAA